jgi:hypothetical protein
VQPLGCSLERALLDHGDESGEVIELKFSH